jgi:hypothetical protein
MAPSTDGGATASVGSQRRGRRWSALTAIVTLALYALLATFTISVPQIDFSWMDQPLKEQPSAVTVVKQYLEQGQPSLWQNSCSPNGTESAVAMSWPRTYNMADIVDGPGLTFNGQYFGKAVCDFRTPDLIWSHPPHAMQQLYACFSWWRANPLKQPVLIFPVAKFWKEGATSPTLVFREPRHIRVHYYILSFLEAMEGVLNAAITTSDTDQGNAVYTLPHALAGYYMHSSSDMPFLRDSILSHYNLKDNRTAGCQKQEALPVLGILNRQNDRSLTNHEALTRAIQQSLPGINVKYTTFEGVSFLQQVKFMSEVDILISPTGAQLMSIPYMPSCGAVFEASPEGYYFPLFFGTLAAVSGLSHFHLYTGADKANETAINMATYEGRTVARARAICLNIEKVVDAVRVMVDQWNLCCASAN